MEPEHARKIQPQLFEQLYGEYLATLHLAGEESDSEFDLDRFQVQMTLKYIVDRIVASNITPT